MESTLFTTLTANEEVNFSGGKKNSEKGGIKVSLIKSLIALILKLTAGAGGAGGAGILNSGSGNVIVNGGTINGGTGGSGGSTSAAIA
ncbi:MAG: hypothetical protein ACYT04_49125 [Nostoc sp.]